MDLKKHYNLVGKHARLSPSSHSWIHYDIDKLETTFLNSLAAQRGTELHAFAHDAIRLGIGLPKTTATLNQYVNDAIGFKMTPEQILYYSDNCFGTADALSFRGKVLRIHDLKTGTIPGHVEQLEVYAALFCLEYDIKPSDIEILMAIYQNDDKYEFVTDNVAIITIMQKIIHFDKRITELRLEALA